LNVARKEQAGLAPTWEKRDSRNYGLVDKQTGEVVDAIPILVPRRRKLGPEFFMGIQKSFVALARFDLSRDTLRILLYVLGRMEYENHVRVGQSEMARDLEMHKSTVSRALKQLAEEGILKPTTPFGRSTFYQLDTQLAWRGKARNRPETGEPPPEKKVRPRKSRAAVDESPAQPAKAE
jgi:DNA-binding transcriptional ArsR family regulator